MNNEPVAWVEEDNINMSGYQFDFQFVAFSHKPKSKADWIPLYTHPSEHDLGIAEAVGFDKGYKAATAKTLTDAEFDNIFANGKRLGVLETEDKFRKVKTLTDEEILEVAQKMGWRGALGFLINFARAILKKASER